MKSGRLVQGIEEYGNNYLWIDICFGNLFVQGFGLVAIFLQHHGFDKILEFIQSFPIEVFGLKLDPYEQYL